MPVSSAYAHHGARGAHHDDCGGAVDDTEGARTFAVAGETYDSFMGRYSVALAQDGLEALDLS